MVRVNPYDLNEIAAANYLSRRGCNRTKVRTPIAAEVDCVNDEAQRMVLKIRELRSEVEFLRGLLRVVQWTHLLPDIQFCPMCHRMKRDGHTVGCSLDAALHSEEAS